MTGIPNSIYKSCGGTDDDIIVVFHEFSRLDQPSQVGPGVRRWILLARSPVSNPGGNVNQTYQDKAGNKSRPTTHQLHEGDTHAVPLKSQQQQQHVVLVYRMTMYCQLTIACCMHDCLCIITCV